MKPELYIRSFIRSIMAGLCIGLGATAYLNVDNRIVGSFLFSLGLLTIIDRGYWLFTGKAYTFRPWREPNLAGLGIEAILMPIMLLGNALGILTLYFLTQPTSTLFLSKLNNSPLHTLTYSIICGILMYLAVSAKNTNPLYVIMPIMVFILCGAEHCIANFFYWCCNPVFTWEALHFFIINIFGNWLGSVLWFELQAKT